MLLHLADKHTHSPSFFIFLTHYTLSFLQQQSIKFISGYHTHTHASVWIYSHSNTYLRPKQSFPSFSPPCPLSDEPAALKETPVCCQEGPQLRTAAAKAAGGCGKREPAWWGSVKASQRPALSSVATSWIQSLRLFANQSDWSFYSERIELLEVRGNIANLLQIKRSSYKLLV